MEEKKIATSVDILINVGNYEHIQITKYAEKKITYTSAEDMIKQEDQLTEELTSDIVRSMRALPNRLGKKTTAHTEIEEKITKKVPEWLLDNVEPNIANNAKTQNDKNKAKANIEEQKVKKEKTQEVKETSFEADGEDLFN